MDHGGKFAQRRKALTKKMDTRRLEELDMDCLSNIFGRIGMESLVLAIPFVCKSWYTLSLNPLFWQSLYFPDFEPYPLFTSNEIEHSRPESFGPFYDKYIEKYQIDKSRFSITAFIKLVVNRSNGKALQLKMPEFSTEDALRYVSDACPSLRVLCLPDDLVIFKHSRIIPEVIGKWKFLKQLCLGGNIKKIRSLFIFCEHGRLSEHFKALLALGSWDKREKYHHYLAPILVQISEHCKHFTSLKIVDASVEELEAYTIVESLPNLKQLCAIESYLKRDSLITILRDCKNLELLDVRNSEGFDEGDDEISRLASHIEFLCEGSVSLHAQNHLCSRNSFNFSYRMLFLTELIKMVRPVAWSTGWTRGKAPRKQLIDAQLKI